MDILQTHLEGGGNLGREIGLLETSWWVSGSRECSLTVKSLDYDFNLFDSNSAVPFAIFVILGKLFIVFVTQFLHS